MSIVRDRFISGWIAGVVVGLALISSPLCMGQTTEESARRAARQFGVALTAADASALRGILPSCGKIKVELKRLGPEDGLFSPGQVEALFKDFLATGKVRTFEVLHLESDGKSSALARGRAVLTDREGRPGRVAIHLAFQPDEGHWVLREVKETAE